ncbi:cobalt-precorrin-6A reductase [Clostridium pasteurianum DSM 525 = ATCC 6013]|uniref:Cobalt-precorrin-6A reductase n=1 Tax=Clostridium pasteurianum DSM 525 = ATCC 6013 TaxID=1262449 RepID=A0A0H3J1T0_CLOPA|nr:cobalt-precorrin-6A reductase [Clostridium pasteurianum]AJA47369.1 cobalt-precorrin-6A reductase [Clostridium pasteurianum DSM 525 = ATCC 6013]AJA51357.1 cobalt-precorrin-6A reductase [Clostridium pasteurianum DSM 525 = ATCC 6013]AOZ74700.1 cobalt-precorrin-6X reductase [Clostridium pasteurianum DSM 525 = ATCC 6013]AOZ78496.1 cobalt-precorrin-6X reductase [Clostridium pasteurianum]ELP58706.1 cobalt-precorrin-6x reductase [Clostridium pasteurianum DSM 525 = ATCC 6013]
MIGLILGTAEGKNILSQLNKYTDDIFVSTATDYGGELLKKFKFRAINTRPLELTELIEILQKNRVKLLLDASHPYAVVITENAIKACKKLGITYMRYERKSVLDNFKENNNIITLRNYNGLKKKISHINGTILNTTGSNNIEKFIDMKLENRIIHRVLPSTKVMEKCFKLGVSTENIIAIKGPIGYELNCGFIREYDVKAMILKDSGVQGGTGEKLKAAVDMGIKAFVIERHNIKAQNSFSSEKEAVDFIVDKLSLI